MKRYTRPITEEEFLNIRDEDIDYSDIPELDDDFWKNAKLVMPKAKQAVSLRMDA